MEDDEAWLYGDDPSAEASAVVDVKKEDDVSISERHNFRYNIAGIIKFVQIRIYVCSNLGNKFVFYTRQMKKW